MCNKSESIAKLAVALVKFNAEVRIIEKDAKNPHFKNQYASLDNIIDAVRPILANNGLSVLQFPSGDGDKFSLRSMLLHESGEWIESEPIVMRPVKNDPQGIGSCATYARRYSLSALLSLNTGEDDDGNDASHPGKAAPITPPASLRAKYQAGKGDMDGFEEWVKDMQTKGQTFTDMENMLAKKLMEKKGGTASA